MDLEYLIEKHKIAVASIFLAILGLIGLGFYFSLPSNNSSIKKSQITKSELENNLSKEFNSNYSNFFNLYQTPYFLIKKINKGKKDYNSYLNFSEYLVLCEKKGDCAYNQYDIYRVLKKEVLQKEKLKQPLNLFRDNGLAYSAYRLSNNLTGDVNNGLFDGMKILKLNDQWKVSIKNNNLTFQSYDNIINKFHNLLCFTAKMNINKIKAKHKNTMAENIRSIGDAWNDEVEILKHKNLNLNIQINDKQILNACKKIRIYLND